MNNEKRLILNSLYDGDITFSEAASKLGVSKDEVEEMMESFDWMPSVSRIVELCEIEKETISQMENRFEHVTYQKALNFTHNYTSISQIPYTVHELFRSLPISLPVVRYPMSQKSLIMHMADYKGSTYSIN